MANTTWDAIRARCDVSDVSPRERKRPDQKPLGFPRQPGWLLGNFRRRMTTVTHSLNALFMPNADPDEDEAGTLTTLKQSGE